MRDGGMRIPLRVLRTLGVGGAFAAYAVAKASRDARTIRIAGEEFAFDLGTRADAFRVVTGDLDVREWERRQDEREERLRRAYGLRP